MAHRSGGTTLIRTDEVQHLATDLSHLDQARSFAPHPKKLSVLIRRISSESGLAFLIPCALYVSVGVLLDFHYEAFNGDAMARMANAFYVLYSRDRHLAAVGFVWNPGTSIADLVPLLFYHVWTPLATHMFAASLVSATAMAGAVYQARSALFEWGVARLVRLTLVAILALNGMILYYGGNGMSEGLYLFSLIATCRYLLRWLRCNDLHSLVYAAIALGLCYLNRNEAVAPAVLAGVVVLGVAATRSSAVGPRKLWAGLDDLIVFEIPFVFAFSGWAIVSYVITGSPFQQFTSVYGTTSQIRVAGSAALRYRVLQDVHDVLYLAPALPVIAIIALVLARKRRDIGVLAPITVVGGGLAFTLLGYIENSIQPWFRYFITAVPLEVLLVGSFFATSPAFVRMWESFPETPRDRSWQRAAIGVFISLMLLGTSSVTTIMGMANPKVGYEETQHLGYIFSRHPTAFENQGPKTYPAVVKMVDYLAKEHLSNGQIIVDNFSVCIPDVIVASPNPDIFVIPNDRTFQRTLADPLVFDAHYILDVDPIGDGALTAPNTTFPNLWSTGDRFAKVVHTFPARGECPEFRLFRVVGHPNQAA